MKVRNLLFTMFAALVFLAGCGEEKEDLGLPVIELSTTNIECEAAGGSSAVSFSASRDWTASVETGASWLGLSAVSGKGSKESQTITVNFDENPSVERSAKITLALEGNLVSKVITVHQKGMEETPVIPDDGAGEGTLESPYNAARALSIASELDSEGKVEGKYVKGKVSEIKEISAEFGNATYCISADGTKEGAQFSIFRSYYLGGEKFTSEDQLKVGDEVIVFGDLVNFKGNTPQMTSGGRIVELNGEAEPDPDEPGDGEYDSNLRWTSVELGYPSETAVVNGSKTVVLKIGTGKAFGKASATIPAGTSKVSFYAVAWKDKPASIKFTVADGEYTFDLAANDGASNNSPFTINVTEEDRYSFEFEEALAEDTEVTVETFEGNCKEYRAIIIASRAE